MDTVPVAAHRKQFILGPRPALAVEGWLSYWIDSSVCLSHCPELRVGLTQDAEGKTCALLGLAVHTIEGEPEPLEQIRHCRSADLLMRRYESWAGRWVLVAGARLHLDASGLLGLFYGRCELGRVWVSSSPALIAGQLGLRDGDEFRGQSLRHETGISWCPPPATPSPKVSRLLPSQVLDLYSGGVVPRRLLPPLRSERPLDETIGLIGSALIESCRGVQRYSNRVWMSLPPDRIPGSCSRARTPPGFP